MRARALRPGLWVLTSSGTPEEVGRAGRKVSGDRTSSLCQVGRTQTPLAPWVSRPSRDKSSVQLGQALVGTSVWAQAKAEVCEWELGRTGRLGATRLPILRAKAPTAQAWPCPARSWRRGLETFARGRGSGQESGSGFDGLRGGRKPARVAEDQAGDLGSCFLPSPV